MRKKKQSRASDHNCFELPQKVSMCTSSHLSLQAPSNQCLLILNVILSCQHTYLCSGMDSDNFKFTCNVHVSIIVGAIVLDGLARLCILPFPLTPHTNLDAHIRLTLTANLYLYLYLHISVVLFKLHGKSLALRLLFNAPIYMQRHKHDV